MKFYCPLDNPQGAIELARDETWKYWQDLVDEGYDPDGINVTTTIKEMDGRYVIFIM